MLAKFTRGDMEDDGTILPDVNIRVMGNADPRLVQMLQKLSTHRRTETLEYHEKSAEITILKGVNNISSLNHGKLPSTMATLMGSIDIH